MSITRAQLEKVLVRRVGNFLTIAGLTATFTGVNPDLDDPIAWGLRMLGYTPAAIDTATDSDLTSVAVAHYDALLDLAELRALENIMGNNTKVSSTVGPSTEQYGQLLSQLEKLLPRKRSDVSNMWSRILAIPLDQSGKRTPQVYAL